MDFFDYLVKKYGYNEVIIGSEISFNNYSRVWIKKMIGKLCNEGKLYRFEKGIYYIPTETLLGKSRLDPKKVITKKYINDGNSIIGYYSGTTLLNYLGLSTQIPNRLEIYTNNEPSRIRQVPIGNQTITLRHARTNITSKNAATLCFLELMNFTDRTFYDDEKRKIIIDYIKKNKITRESISEYSPYFPDKAMRTLIESEVIYYVA